MLLYSNTFLVSQNLIYSNIYYYEQVETSNNNNCNNIYKLLASIDCKLAELGNDLYNNISYMLNKNIDTCVITKLLMYKSILSKKNINPNYLKNWCISDIGDAVKTLTIGCVRKCFKPEECYEINYQLENIK